MKSFDQLFEELAAKLATREAGADTFVAGSAVFNSPEPSVMVEMLRHRASAV